jgi:hypothetical protein
VEESILRFAERGVFREMLCEASLRRYVCEHVLLGELKAALLISVLWLNGVHHSTEAQLVTEGA